MTVAWVGDRWLAGGQVGLRAATWVSSDGLTWTSAAPMPPEPVEQTADGDPGTGYWVTAVTPFGGELLAFGWNRIGCCDGGKPMAWRSADGSSWSVVATEGTAFDTYQFPTSAATAPDGSLVLASAIGLGSGAAVFTTGDLLGWEQNQLTSPGSFEGLSAVAAAPTMLMGVGYGHEDDDDRTHQRAWVSSDGRAWGPIAPPSEVGTLSGVAWDPVRQRFLVSGQDDQLRAVVWLTADGGSWTSVRLSSGEGMVQDVDVVDGLLVAIGTEGLPDQSRMMVWSSLDGMTWQIADLGPSENGLPLGAAGTNGAVVLLNGVGPAPDHAPTLTAWRGTR